MVIKMVGTKRKKDEAPVEQITENKGSKNKDKKKLENVDIQDTETKIAQELNGVDSNEDSDDSDSSVYSDLDEEEDENDEEEENASEDENENENMSTNEDEDTDESDDNDDGKENNENDASVQKNPEKKEKNSAKKEKNSTEGNKKEDKIKDNEEDEYEQDSSDEEDIRNTIGNVPIQWYDDYDHLGYNLEGSKIRKPAPGDKLDAFLSKMDDPNFGVTVRDPTTGQDVVLSERDVEIIKRLGGAKIPNPEFGLFGENDPLRDAEFNWFSSEVMQTPIRAIPESKKSFLPSVDEKRAVGKMVHAIKMGWMKAKTDRKADEEDPERRSFYMMWKTDNDQEDEVRRIKDTIPAPKMKLPGHEESYNPPPEYVMTDQERERWESLEDEPWKRKTNFVPQKFDSLRRVPAYSRFISERFERCLDLYLAPRARKMRLTIQPEDLVPQLPKPQDLQPFPQTCALTYKGHKNMIRTISPEPRGQFVATGSDDGTVRVWEVQSGYCHKTFEFGKSVVITSVAWCPNGSLSLLAVAVENRLILLNADVGDKLVVEQTTDLILGEESANIDPDYMPPERVKSAVEWETPDVARPTANANQPNPISIPQESLAVLKFFKPVKQVTWHAKGDYFATVCADAANRSVLIHQLSKRRSQIPFNKSKGLVQSILFHPIRPFLFVATQRHVRVYNLTKQELSKKLMTGAKWISSIAVHPHGDNVLVGTFDKRVQWFDLDLSTSPYKVLKYHSSAVRSVAYHSRYPLFASSSDDPSVVVSHGMVYNDLLQNPLIVPVKHLKGHTKYDDYGVMSVIWHPTQPWLFSAGADGYLKLWT